MSLISTWKIITKAIYFKAYRQSNCTQPLKCHHEFTQMFSRNLRKLSTIFFFFLTSFLSQGDIKYQRVIEDHLCLSKAGWCCLMCTQVNAAEIPAEYLVCFDS